LEYLHRLGDVSSIAVEMSTQIADFISLLAAGKALGERLSCGEEALISLHP
jgi:hypothetical protein